MAMYRPEVYFKADPTIAPSLAPLDVSELFAIFDIVGDAKRTIMGQIAQPRVTPAVEERLSCIVDQLSAFVDTAVTEMRGRQPVEYSATQRRAEACIRHVADSGDLEEVLAEVAHLIRRV